MTLRALVRFDGLAALVSGCSVLFIGSWIAGWSGIPADVLRVMACIALVYATYSLTLSTREQIPPLWLKVLIAGNSVWAMVCVGVIFAHWTSITLPGIGYLLFEALFVAALAWYEFSSLSTIRR